MTNDTQLCRVEFPTFVQMPTRWMDNDAYGHMNNIADSVPFISIDHPTKYFLLTI